MPSASLLLRFDEHSVAGTIACMLGIMRPRIGTPMAWVGGDDCLCGRNLRDGDAVQDNVVACVEMRYGTKNFAHVDHNKDTIEETLQCHVPK